MEVKCSKCNTLLKKLDEEKDSKQISYLAQDIGMGVKTTGIRFADVFVCENCSEDKNGIKL